MNKDSIDFEHDRIIYVQSTGNEHILASNSAFQNLGFERGPFAPPLAWVLAMVVAIAYIIYTTRVIPLILTKQKAISLFKLVGILAALVGGITV